MQISATAISDVLLLEPERLDDATEYFLESFYLQEFRQASGLAPRLVQDHQEQVSRHVLRGLHYRLDRPQCQLVRVLSGTAFTVAVDIRTGSPTFGNWIHALLSGENGQRLWIPQGVALGYLVLSDQAQVLCRSTVYRDPAAERCIRWDDPQLAIDWPLLMPPRLSRRDSHGLSLAEAQLPAFTGTTQPTLQR